MHMEEIKERVAKHSPQYDRVLSKLKIAEEEAQRRYVKTGDRTRLDSIQRRVRLSVHAFYKRVNPEIWR